MLWNPVREPFLFCDFLQTEGVKYGIENSLRTRVDTVNSSTLGISNLTKSYCSYSQRSDPHPLKWSNQLITLGK